MNRATYICGPTDGNTVTEDMLNERYWTGYIDWNEWNEGYHSRRRTDKDQSLPWRAGWQAKRKARANDDAALLALAGES